MSLIQRPGSSYQAARTVGRFCFSPAQRDKNGWTVRQDRTTTETRPSPEWQARPVTKSFVNLGVQSALTRRDGPERLSGGNDAGIGKVAGSCVSHLALRSYSRYKNAMPKKTLATSRNIRFIETMDCLPVSTLPEGPEWTYEILCGGQHKNSWTKPLRGTR